MGYRPLQGVLVPLITMLASQVAWAQRWQVDVSGTRVEFDTIATLNSATVSPFVEWERGVAFTNFGASLTAFEGGDFSAQGRGDLSLLFRPVGPLSPIGVEVLGAAAGTHHSSDFRTATTRGEFRVHVSGRQVGAWAGVVGGTGWSTGSGGVTTGAGPTGGVWGRYGTARTAVMFTPVRLEGTWFPEVHARASVALGPVELVAYAGWRDSASGGTIDASTWGGATAAVWLMRNAALVIGGGSYPSDLFQALPSGRYLSGGLRVATRRPTVPSITPIGRPVYEREDGSGVLRFRIPRATRVDLVGDWSGWQPMSMRQVTGGFWELRIDLPAGVHRFNLVVDGEEWIVPEGVPAVADGFGGRTGLLIVP